ncbi:MAG: MGMT family protein, partial [Acidobacteriota bacterium]|nr:MGMT family protein [Acidobacteriota bacterium]
MAHRKKTWREKFENSNGSPKVVALGADLRRRWGGGTCVIATPRLVDALMKKVPRGKVTTINEIRAALAKDHGAEIACPITTGIFASIAAHVAVEDKAMRKIGATPYWRTLKAGGEINPKYPGGIEAQAELLRAEGHVLVIKGKKTVVKDWEN